MNSLLTKVTASCLKLSLLIASGQHSFKGLMTLGQLNVNWEET